MFWRVTISLAILVLLVSCGRGLSPRSDGTSTQSQREFITQQLVQLDRLPLPAGADPAAWNQLKTAMSTMLGQKLADGASRGASSAPATDGARMQLSFDEGTAKLSWGYYCPGDYDQNGEVNISDLTPLGAHFGENAKAAPADSVLKVIDGDGNGELNISDLTPIGAGFGESVQGYNVFQSFDLQDTQIGNTDPSPIASFANAPLSGATGVPSQTRLQLAFTVATPQAGITYWVRPTDGTVEGTRSTLAGGPPDHPAHIGLQLCPSEGPAPFVANFNADRSGDMDHQIEFYRWDFEDDGVFDPAGPDTTAPSHIYETAGTYTCVLETEDDYGHISHTEIKIRVGQPAGFTAGEVGAGENYTPTVPTPGADIELVDGHPAMLWTEYLGGNTGVHFARALDAAGSQWPAVAAVQQISPITERSPFLVVPASGKPLAFAGQQTIGVQIIRALDIDGTAWAAPQVINDTSVGGIALIGAGLVGGNPAIVYSDGENYRYRRATDADGTAWAASVQFAMEPNAFLNPYRAAGPLDVQGRPGFIAFNETTADVDYFLGDDAAGTTWAAPVPIALGVTSDLFESLSSFILIDGDPAFLASAESYNTMLLRASDPFGSTWLEPAFLPTYGRAVLREVGATPGMLVFDENMVWYAQSLDPVGAQWGPRELLDCDVLIPSGDLVDIGGKPGAGYNTQYDIGGFMRFRGLN